MHGFFDDPRTTGLELCFGVCGLFNAIESSQRGGAGATVPPWPFRTIDRQFEHLGDSLRHVVAKLERAASLYATNASEFGDDALSLRSAGYHRQLDLSIHLDSVVVYLRLLPDIVAAAVPYLYAASDAIAMRSFRAHSKWFLGEGNGAIDPPYAELLRSHSRWFDLLAGKNGLGVRDLLIHRFGRFQHPVTISPPSLAGTVGSDLITATGYVVDANETIREAAHGMFAFFDHFVAHHRERIEAAAGWRFAADQYRTGYITTVESTAPSKWLFPVRSRPRR